jgi:hypothetical protein
MEMIVANYFGRSGAPMREPTKDQLRQDISNLRVALAIERTKRKELVQKIRKLMDGESD